MCRAVLLRLSSQHTEGRWRFFVFWHISILNRINEMQERKRRNIMCVIYIYVYKYIAKEAQIIFLFFFLRCNYIMAVWQRQRGSGKIGRHRVHPMM